ncbi:WD repeat domain phosphoinositide-interacting protein 3 [Phlyctochytrium planicorne]|nr:WD repeat domain phosphoinositide-interacting protein 3 [Phlyctochytrium planicorne]
MNLTHRPAFQPNPTALRASSSTSAATAPSTSATASSIADAHNAAQGLLYVGFNQDASCFGVGTVAGFRIYSTDPLHERARREHVPFLLSHRNNSFGGDGTGVRGLGGAVGEEEVTMLEEEVGGTPSPFRPPELKMPPEDKGKRNAVRSAQFPPSTKESKTKPPRLPADTGSGATPLPGEDSGDGDIDELDDEEWRRERRLKAGKGRADAPSIPQANTMPFDDLRDIDEDEDYDELKSDAPPHRGRRSSAARSGVDGNDDYEDDEADDYVKERPASAAGSKPIVAFARPASSTKKSPSASPPLIVEVEDDSDDFGLDMDVEDDPTSPYATMSTSPKGAGIPSNPSASPFSPGSSSSLDSSIASSGNGNVPSLPPRPELDRPGGIAIVEMLYRSNYVALVGGGRNPKFPPNRVIVWDDLKGRVIMQFQFRSEVKAVKLRKDRMVIVFWNRVVVYTFSPRPRRLHTFETMRNDHGLCSLSPSPLAGLNGRPNTAVLAFLGRLVGQVQICELHLGPVSDPTTSASRTHSSASNATSNPNRRSYPSSNDTTAAVPLPPQPTPDTQQRSQPVMTGTSSSARASPLVISPPSPLPNPPISIIVAHNSGLSCFTVSHSGHLIATASETGTLIRVFETRSGRLVNELRRGLDRAEIYCIAFNMEGTRICVSSDKGTIHVFNVGGSQSHSPAAAGVNLDPAVASSSFASQTAFPSGRATPGGIVINGLGGNTISMSPAIGLPPIQTSNSNPAPYAYPGPVKPGKGSSGKGSTVPTASSTSTSSQSLASGLTNRLSTLSFFSPISKYFSSEWSFAQFTLPVEAKCICAFAASDLADDGPTSAARRAVAVFQPDSDAGLPSSPTPAPAAPAPSIPKAKESASTSRALYFDPKTLTATTVNPASKSTRPLTSPTSPTDPKKMTQWSPGPVVNANAVICLCADGSSYKFCFETPPGGPGASSVVTAGSGNVPARDGILESFVKFYRGVGVDPDGVGVGDPDMVVDAGVVDGDQDQFATRQHVSAEGFLVSTSWGRFDEDDD